jgi:hypothetical protein
MSNHHPPQSSEQIARQQAQPTSESAAPQQAFVDTRARLLRPADLLQLQRSIGNRATGQLVLGRRGRNISAKKGRIYSENPGRRGFGRTKSSPSPSPRF